MNTLRAAFVILAGFIVYISAATTVEKLPEIYKGVVNRPSESEPEKLELYDKAVNHLGQLSSSTPVQQGLSWILASFAALATGLFSRNKDEGTNLEDHYDRSDSRRSRRLITESGYVERSLAQYDKLQGKHQELRAAHQRTARRLFNTQKFALRQYPVAMVFATALFFAFSYLVAAGCQSVVKLGLSKLAVAAADAEPAADADAAPDPQAVTQYTLDLPEPVRFMALFPQTIALLVCAFIVPFIFYRRYIRVVGSTDIKSIILIGFVGVITPGLFGYLTQGPESWALLLSAEYSGTGELPYFGIHMLPFQAISRLIVFPLVGLSACLAATLVGRAKLKRK